MTFVVNTFFGCFKLRTGCFIIGYFGAVGNFIALVASIFGIIFTALRNNTLTGDHKDINTILMWIFVILLVACSIWYAIYVVLLVGLHQNRPKLLKVHLTLMTIYLTITLIAVIFITVFVSPLLGLRAIVSYVCNIYYVLVVRSYYLKMKETTYLKTGMKPV